jgi:predicted amidohydrolase YtcJ
VTGTVLLRGGVIHTPAAAAASAMLVTEGVVSWVGPQDRAPATADAVVELGGALVTPAFVDGHIHATSTGLALSGLDLRDAPSLAVALDLVEQRCRQLRGATILGHGWDESFWPEGRPPTAAELDRASYGSVVYLSRADVHSAVVSSALLAAVPEVVGLDGYDRSGWLRRTAHHAARRAALDALSPDEVTAAQRITLSRAASLGIAAVHEMAGPDINGEDDLANLLSLSRRERLPEVVGYWGQTAADGGLTVVARHRLRGAGGDLFVDGAIGSRTACLSRPYDDAPGECGALYLDADQAAAHLLACTSSGVQAGFHVIGDRAMATVVDALAAVAAELGEEKVRTCRHRLEHAEMVTVAQALVLARLGVHASVQPAFDQRWGMGAGLYEARLGPDRAPRLNPFAELAEAGVPLAFGSDAPVTPLDPWGGLRAAVQHRTPASRLAPAAALHAHTAGAWRAAGVDDAGVLAPGQQASYAVWAGDRRDEQAPGPGTDVLADLLAAPPAPACLRTVLRGRIIHDSDQLGGGPTT